MKKTETMTIKEIAKLLGVGVSTVRRAVKKKFPSKMENGNVTEFNQDETTIIISEIKKKGFLEKTSLNNSAIQNEQVAIQNEQVAKRIDLAINTKVPEIIEKVTEKLVDKLTPVINNGVFQIVTAIGKLGLPYSQPQAIVSATPTPPPKKERKPYVRKRIPINDMTFRQRSKFIVDEFVKYAEKDLKTLPTPTHQSIWMSVYGKLEEETGINFVYEAKNKGVDSALQLVEMSGHSERVCKIIEEKYQIPSSIVEGKKGVKASEDLFSLPS
jgi:hypothetical protein